MKHPSQDVPSAMPWDACVVDGHQHHSRAPEEEEGAHRNSGGRMSTTLVLGALSHASALVAWCSSLQGGW